MADRLAGLLQDVLDLSIVRPSVCPSVPLSVRSVCYQTSEHYML